MIRRPDPPHLFPFPNGIRMEIPRGRTVQDLARTIAARANSGGGGGVLCGDAGAAERMVAEAATMIVPVPVVRTGPTDAGGERRVESSLVIRPPDIAFHAEKGGFVLTVTPGDSLCTVGGTVYVLEEGEARPLSIMEVVKRLGSGG